MSNETSMIVTVIANPFMDLPKPLATPKSVKRTRMAISATSAYQVVADRVVINIMKHSLLSLLNYIINSRAG